MTDDERRAGHGYYAEAVTSAALISTGHGSAGYGPTLHVKITEHFLLALESRPMGPEASADLWSLIAGRDLHRITCELRPGQRGALAVAGDGEVHLIVFCRDAGDPALCALLTVLSVNEAPVVARRRDTVLCSLKGGLW